MKLLLALFFFVTSCATKTLPPKEAREAEVAHAWLQWTANSTLELRTIGGLECPKASAIAKNSAEIALVMTPRASTTKDFPSLVCMGIVPKNTQFVNVHTGVGHTLILSVPVQKMARIVLFGDSGCRLKEGSNGHPGAYQECNDPEKWPLSKIAKAAAKLKPDLVIHLGDLHYREAPCPNGNPGCAGSVVGYGESAWRADFFEPARPLLEMAPWLIVRGNHESCARAGAGWFQYLDPTSYRPCEKGTPNYSVQFGNHELVVIDAAEMESVETEIANLKPQKGFRWVLIHRPFLTLNKDPKLPKAELIPKKLRKPGQISLVLAGHVHVISLNEFADWRPLELIVGTGGSALEKNADYLLKNDGDRLYQRVQFGFASMDQLSPSKWKLRLHDVDGKVYQACEIQESLHKKSTLKCDSDTTS